ncbi:MAG: beta-galactosidase [Chloroflexota bacterium]|nr:beta-galactosidase [Chloroflexota bacterium]
MRSARAAAGLLVEAGRWRSRHLDLSAAISAVLLITLGVAIAIGGITADTYLHRGVETSDEEPFVIQPTGDALATNADLRLFLPGELQDVAGALETSGFSYVRQPVSWAEIEPEQGTYDWSEMDQIVNELARREIEMVAVVQDAPEWSRDADTLDAVDAPPIDPSALGSFMQEFTARYGDAVPFVQVWEEPNNPAHWGGMGATPATFLPYLAAAHNGARAGNPEVQIVTPELSWRTDPLTERADLDFLEGLYGLGAEPFFDIVGIELDGGLTSPDDRRISARRHNFSRAVLVRELMVRSEDASTPVWATSLGWARSADVPESEQAEFVARALERSWVEWPWMGLLFQWSFFGAGGAAEAYAMVQPDGTATQLYRRLTDTEFQERTHLAETGFLPMDAPAVRDSGAWENQHLENRTFRTTSEVGSEVTVQFRGTGAMAIMRIGPESGNVIVEIDGEPLEGGAGESGEEWDLTWSSTEDIPVDLVSGLDYGEHTLTIRLAEEGSLTLGGIVIERQQPFVWPVVMLTAGALVSLFFGIRSIAVLIARHSGFLAREDEQYVGTNHRSALALAGRGLR